MRVTECRFVIGTPEIAPLVLSDELGIPSEVRRYRDAAYSKGYFPMTRRKWAAGLLGTVVVVASTTLVPTTQTTAASPRAFHQLRPSTRQRPRPVARQVRAPVAQAAGEGRTPHQPGGPDDPRRPEPRPGAPHSAGRRQPGGLPQAGRGPRDEGPGGRRQARARSRASSRSPLPASWRRCPTPAPSSRRSSRRPAWALRPARASRSSALTRCTPAASTARASPSVPCRTPTTLPPRPSPVTR